DPRDAAVAPLVERFGVAVVEPSRAHMVDCDIWSPCALGAVLSASTIPALRCLAVVGAANNQLASTDDDGRLAERGIVYVPDFVANAGGVINISEEVGGYDRDRAFAHVAGIEQTVAR